MIWMFGLVALFLILDAACDAIDHAKGAQDLLELWHILKGIRNTIPVFLVLTVCTSFKWALLLVIPVMVISGCLWEASYWFFRGLEIYRWDNLNWKWLRKLWRFGLK